MRKKKREFENLKDEIQQREDNIKILKKEVGERFLKGEKLSKEAAELENLKNKEITQQRQEIRKFEEESWPTYFLI